MSLREFSDDSGELFLEDKEAEQKEQKEAERVKAQAVPGMLKVRDLLQPCEAQMNRADRVIAPGPSLPSKKTKSFNQELKGKGSKYSSSLFVHNILHCYTNMTFQVRALQPAMIPTGRLSARVIFLSLLRFVVAFSLLKNVLRVRKSLSFGTFVESPKCMLLDHCSLPGSRPPLALLRFDLTRPEFSNLRTVHKIFGCFYGRWFGSESDEARQLVDPSVRTAPT